MSLAGSWGGCGLGVMVLCWSWSLFPTRLVIASPPLPLPRWVLPRVLAGGTETAHVVRDVPLSCLPACLPACLLRRALPVDPPGRQLHRSHDQVGCPEDVARGAGGVSPRLPMTR